MENQESKIEDQEQLSTPEKAEEPVSVEETVTRAKDEINYQAAEVDRVDSQIPEPPPEQKSNEVLLGNYQLTKDQLTQIEADSKYTRDEYLSEVQRIYEGTDELPPEIETSQEEIEKSRNYDGNWTELSYDRLMHPSTFRKFLEKKLEHFPTDHSAEAQTDPENQNINLARPISGSTYQEASNAVFQFQENVKSAFRLTGYVNAAEAGKLPSHLGLGGDLGEPGVVFKDAAKDGKELTPRQKDIINAHEKLHGVMKNLTEGEGKELRSVLNSTKIGYKKSVLADEYLARMSQLKNYFGMKGNETFTGTHLDLAKQHYIKDTELDNNMMNFLNGIDEETREGFIKAINEYPC